MAGLPGYTPMRQNAVALICTIDAGVNGAETESVRIFSTRPVNFKIIAG